MHAGNSYECIFDETSGETERDGPSCVMRSRDVDGVLTYGDIVQVHGGNYTIEGMRPDGTGTTALVLEAT